LWDALVVGAGIIGLSTAYHIKRLNPHHRVLVVDMLGGPGRGNTARSVGMFRDFFHSRTNRLLAGSSVKFYMDVSKQAGLDLRMNGYLWILSPEEYRGIRGYLRGYEYRMYDGDELERLIGLNTSGNPKLGLPEVECGMLIPKAGSIDVKALVAYYYNQFLRMGGEARFGVKVRRLLLEAREAKGLPGEPHLWQDARVSGVETDVGLIRAKKTVVAVGGWAPVLMDRLGVECHVKAKKRQVFIVGARHGVLNRLVRAGGFLMEGYPPMFILPKFRVYVRPHPEKRLFFVGCSDHLGRPFMVEDKPRPEEEFYEYGIKPVLTHYLPSFSEAPVVGSWAGLYAICTLDHQPVVFEEADMIFVGGASGSGIIKADAVGRVAASLYSGLEEAELYDGRTMRVSDLGLRNRRVEREVFVI